MLDLSLSGSRQFWKDYDDPAIYHVVTFMEGVEGWTLDDDLELEQAITRLGRELSDIGKIDMTKLKHADCFIRLACNIKSSRVLRLLQTIDTAHPGSASKILIHAEETTKSNKDIPGIFLRRNIVFERLRLLSRIFSSERFQLVTQALEKDD